tara:strand:- start:15422 stop:16069 length:648 start_codon:yes stop_codon:yes gene_type:complete
LAPQFETLGERPTFMGAKYVDIFGTGINVGRSATFVATSDSNIRLTTWNLGEFDGKIYADDYCLFTPGVRIAAATEIKIGKGCMFANGSYVSDADWHGIYKRAEPVGATKKVELKDNVWIGDRAVVGKGVTIGENSIVGAGAIVVKDVPDNVVVGGNPARIIKDLDPNEKFITREDLFKDPLALEELYDYLDKVDLKSNYFFSWLKSLVFPSKKQ